MLQNFAVLYLRASCVTKYHASISITLKQSKLQICPRVFRLGGSEMLLNLNMNSSSMMEI
jgi:hypothetical protein